MAMTRGKTSCSRENGAWHGTTGHAQEDLKAWSTLSRLSYNDKNNKNLPLSAKLQNLRAGDWVMLRHGGLEPYTPRSA